MGSHSSPAIAVCILFSIVANFGQSSAWTCESSRNVTLTKPMLDHLTWRIRSKIFSLVRTGPDGKQFRALVPGFIRLAFHACSAKYCSSRIDFSDLNNNGLQDAVAAAEELHAAVQNNSNYTGFSKADLYALCGVVALQVATQNKTRVMFRYGRPDFCAHHDPNNLNQTIPSNILGSEAKLAFMKSVFNFTAKETVTIMGSHCLGAMRNLLSPPVPIGRWVSTPADSFNNEYYKALLDRRWQQVDLSLEGLPFLAKVWAIEKLPKHFLFNADFGLVRRISASATGAAQCTTFSSCPVASTAGFVNNYANNKQVFFNDFDVAFEKMIENGLRSKLFQVATLG